MFLPQETRPENYLGNGVRQIRPTLRRFCVRTSWGKTRITIFVCLNAHYRASNVLEDLGWVDLDLGSSPGWWAATVGHGTPCTLFCVQLLPEISTLKHKLSRETGLVDKSLLSLPKANSKANSAESYSDLGSDNLSNSITLDTLDWAVLGWRTLGLTLIFFGGTCGTIVGLAGLRNFPRWGL